MVTLNHLADVLLTRFAWTSIQAVLLIGTVYLIGRLLPVIRTFIAFPAGVTRMNRAKFHLYTTIGSWPWCFALAWIGMKLGAAWDSDPRIKAAFHSADAVIVVLVLAAAAWFVWSRLKGRKRTP